VVAVAESRTWSDVCRRLGLATGSSALHTVQGHVARLRLEVGHLPPPRTVEPATLPPTRPSREDLTAAIGAYNSWADVLRCLGLKVTSASYAWLHKSAADFDLDTAHLRGHAWNSEAVEAGPLPFTRTPDAANLSKASAAIATAWFMRRGYVVSVPVEPTRYDLVVESDDNTLARVQVKSTVSKDRQRWIVGIARRQYDKSVPLNANGARVKSVYQPHEIDYFFIVTGDGGQYLIPLSVTNGSTTLTLDSKYAAYKVGLPGE
jgi:hypothetical protein